MVNRTQRRQAERKEQKRNAVYQMSENDIRRTVEKLVKEKQGEISRLVANQISAGFTEALHLQLGLGKVRMERVLKDAKERIVSIKQEFVSVEDIWEDLGKKDIPVLKFEGDE